MLSFIYLVIPSTSGPRSAPWDFREPFLANFQQKLWKAWKRETQLQLHHGSKLFGSSGNVSKNFDTCSGKSLYVAASQWSPSLANAAVKFQADRKWKPPLLFQPVGELWSSRLFAPVCRSFVLKHAEKLPFVMSHRANPAAAALCCLSLWLAVIERWRPAAVVSCMLKCLSAARR